MSPTEVTLLVGIASGMMVLGIMLFRMADDKKRAMDDDADSTYAVIRKRVLEPALLSIIESKREGFKIKDLFRDPDVATKLDAYKRALFEYNESGVRRGAVLAHIGLAYKASFFTAGIVYLVLGADALATSLGRLDEVSSAAPAIGWSTAVIGAATVGYSLYRYRAEDGAFRLEMRKIRSGLS